MMTISDLKPIPTEATGEVVGTVVVEDDGGTLSMKTKDRGVYDVVRRPK